jgi:hypothetical protein
MRIALIWMLIKAAGENDQVNMVGLSADAKRWLTKLSLIDAGCRRMAG